MEVTTLEAHAGRVRHLLLRRAKRYSALTPSPVVLSTEHSLAFWEFAAALVPQMHQAGSTGVALAVACMHQCWPPARSGWDMADANLTLATQPRPQLRVVAQLLLEALAVMQCQGERVGTDSHAAAASAAFCEEVKRCRAGQPRRQYGALHLRLEGDMCGTERHMVTASFAPQADKMCAFTPSRIESIIRGTPGLLSGNLHLCAVCSRAVRHSTHQSGWLCHVSRWCSWAAAVVCCHWERSGIV